LGYPLFHLCVIDGEKRVNHLIQRRDECDFEHAFRWVMECGVHVIAAEPMAENPEFPVCERCLKTKRGLGYQQRLVRVSKKAEAKG